MDGQRVELGENGFTLVELVVTVAVIVILASLATVQFRKMATNASVEKELRMIYTDLMELRTKAMFEKSPRAARFTRTSFHIYSSADTGSTPVMSRTLPHAVDWNVVDSSLVVKFNTHGVSNRLVTLCVEPDGEHSSSVDSIVISQARLRMGKLGGETCTGEAVFLK